MKIAILDDYQDQVRQLDCFRLLDGHEVKVFTSSARGIGQLAIRLAPFDVLVPIRERTIFSRQLLVKLPNLKLIAQTGRAGAHIDLSAAAAQGVAVAESASDPAAAAELAWALIMASRRKLPQYAGLLKQGIWQTTSLQPEHNTLGSALRGKTIGIWGYGKTGRLVAGYARAFGMRVMVWGSEGSRALACEHGYMAAASKDSLFAEADILSLHLRLGDATRGCVTAYDLARMKPDALFVNTSRAELVEAGALQAALEQGRPGSAALDVFESEPLPPDTPLLRMPNVLATPHLGYVERDNYERLFRSAFEKVRAFAAGAPLNLVKTPTDQ